MAKGPKPWERQPDETSKKYAAFCLYRDMGAEERTYAKVATQVGKSIGYIERLGRENKWRDRVEKWDDEQDRIAREIAQKERNKGIADMLKRHTDMALSVQTKALKALTKMSDFEMKGSDIKGLLEFATKLERLSRGVAGEIVEERDGGKAESVVQFYMPDNGRDKKQEDGE